MSSCRCVELVILSFFVSDFLEFDLVFWALGMCKRVGVLVYFESIWKNVTMLSHD